MAFQRSGLLMRIFGYIGVAWIIGFVSPLLGGITSSFLSGLGFVGTIIGYAIQGGIVVFVVSLVMRALGGKR